MEAPNLELGQTQYRWGWLKVIWGQLVRGHTGRWIIGFTKKIDIFSAFIVKLQGAYWGLHVAWDNGHRQIILESDSRSALDTINKIEQTPLNTPYRALIQRIQALMNAVADSMANLSVGEDYNLVVLESSP